MAGYFAYEGGSGDTGPDSVRVYGPAAGDIGEDPWLVVGEVAAGETVEALWFQVAGVPFPGAHALAPAGAHPFTPLCSYGPESLTTYGTEAQGNSGPVRIEVGLAAEVAPLMAPDTLFSRQAASFPALVDLPPSMALTLTAEDASGGGKTVGGFFLTDPPGTPDPKPVPRSGLFLPTTLQTTAGELSRVRFVAALDDADTTRVARLRIDATAWGEVAEYTVPIYSSLPDSVEVLLSTLSVGAGDAVTVTARVYNRAGRFVPPEAVGFAPMAVGVRSDGGGLLHYEGEAAGVFRIRYDDLAGGAVTFIATGEGCSDAATLIASARGADGIFSSTAELSLLNSGERAVGGKGATNPCGTADVRVTQQEVWDWATENCDGIDTSTPQGEQLANTLFEEVVAESFGVKMESKDPNVQSPRPVDGYEVENGYVVKLYETKNVKSWTFNNSGLLVPKQAMAHIQRLVDHREALRANAIDEHG